jgi:hypothetical protein
LGGVVFFFGGVVFLGVGVGWTLPPPPCGLMLAAAWLIADCVLTMKSEITTSKRYLNIMNSLFIARLWND